MVTAIHYSSVRKPPKVGQIYGIQVAILDWLRAWLRHGSQERFTFLVADEAGQREVLDIAAEVGVDASRLVLLDGRLPRENFGKLTRVFRADPDSRDLLWQRKYAGASFSFCGLAHAVSGIETARVLEQFCLAPTSERDAIVCPSRAVASAIRHYWEHVAAFWEEKLGAAYACPVRLPIIPLGVDTSRIVAKVGPDKRKKQREILNIADDEIVLLWVGRLSYAIKAHPLPIFRAAELAAQRTGKKVRLLMQGYFVPEDCGPEFEALARDVCKQAQVQFIAADDPRFPDGLWAAGDIFLSLVENMQESFGLTPIEAIAAGLPRVVSDWDGYRDAVTQGEDGFLVPTLQPPSGMGLDLAATLLGERETYGGYLALTAQCVAVDHEAAAQAIIALIERPELRSRMAAKAKERLPDYDWARVIRAYEEVEKAEEDKSVAASRGPVLHPHAPDPFTMYRDYPSRALSLETRFTLTAEPEEMRILFKHKMNTLAAPFLMNGEDISALLGGLAAKGEMTVATLLAAFPACDPPRVWRTVAWLMKLGIMLPSSPSSLAGRSR